MIHKIKSRPLQAVYSSETSDPKEERTLNSADFTSPEVNILFYIQWGVIINLIYYDLGSYF